MSPSIPAPSRVAALALTLTLGVTGTLHASASGPLERCYRATLDGSLHKINSAMWLPETEEILVLDQRSKTLSMLAVTGETTRSVTFENRPPVAILPVFNKTTERQEYLEYYGDSHVVWRDAQLSPRHRDVFDLSQSFEGGLTLASTYQRIVAGDSLVGYGAIDDPNTPSTRYDYLGFFRRNLAVSDSSNAGSGTTKLLKTSPGTMDFYTLGLPYIATVGSVAYFVVLDPMHGAPALYRFDPDRDTEPVFMPGFPAAQSELPVFSLEGVSSYADGWQRIEALNAPIGLYADGGSLYMLSRRPDGDATAWQMTQMIPGHDGIVESESLTLPTRANHLTVVPADNFWAFFEKGPVNKNDHQAINSMMVMPASWITDPAYSPLYSAAANGVTCPPLER